MCKMAKAFGFEFGTLMAKNPFYQYLLYFCIHIFPLWNGARVAGRQVVMEVMFPFSLRQPIYKYLFEIYANIFKWYWYAVCGQHMPNKKMGEHIFGHPHTNIRTYINTKKLARKGNGWILHNSRILRRSLLWMILNYDTSFPAVAIVVVLAFVVYKMYRCNCLSPYACISLFFMGLQHYILVFWYVPQLQIELVLFALTRSTSIRNRDAYHIINNLSIFGGVIGSLEPFMHPYIRATSFFSSWRTCFQFFQLLKENLAAFIDVYMFVYTCTLQA